MFSIPMKIKLSIFWLILCALSTVNCSTICDSCYCLESDDDLYIIKCKGHPKYKTEIDFENIVWPETSRSIIAYFNELNLFVLPK